jgi:hypothetical protein
MKLQQFINSFIAPLAAEDARPLVRLLACRNKTARGLSDTVGAIEVGRAVSRRFHDYGMIPRRMLMPGIGATAAEPRPLLAGTMGRYCPSTLRLCPCAVYEQVPRSVSWVTLRCEDTLLSSGDVAQVHSPERPAIALLPMAAGSVVLGTSGAVSASARPP